MAGNITLSSSITSNGATSATVKITMYYYGNGYSWSDQARTGKIIFNGSTKSFTHGFSTSSSQQELGSASFTVNKTHSAQSLTASGTFDASNTSLGVLKASTTVSISAKTSYTVSYAASGGSGTTTAQTKWYNESLTLRGALTRSGYGFSKWKATNGTLYNASASYTANAATTMTAQWTGNTYYVKFNANGGSGTMANQTFTYGAAQKALTKNTFTRTGYTFNGWKTAVSSGTSYTDGQSVSNLTSTANATVNLYAQWTPVIYTITLNNQSATSAGTTVYYEKYATGTYSNSTATTSMTSITIPNKNGYNFGGYYTTTNGGGVQYIDSSGKITATNTTFAKNTTLYALWIEAYVPPKITNVKIVRCNDNGTETLSGNYVKFSFNWTAGIAQDGTANNNTNINIVATINDGFENGTEIEYNETGLTEESGVIENNISSSSIPYSNPGSIVITILDVIENYSSSITAYIPEGGFPIHISQKENNITLFGTCDENKQGLIINNNIEIKGQTNQCIKLQNNLLDVISNMRLNSRTGNESKITMLASNYDNMEILYSGNGNIGFYDRTYGDWLLRMDTENKNVYMPIANSINLGTTSEGKTRDVFLSNTKRTVTFSLNSSGDAGLYHSGTGWIVKADMNNNVSIPNGIFAAPKSIVHGSVTITPSAANTPTSKAVTWTAMAGVPHIALGAYTGVPGTQVTGVGFNNPSATGCSIVVTRTNTNAFATHYIAIY